MLAYLLTIYDDTFGGVHDYAKAFAAGFLGQAVVGAAMNWDLFPAFRNYRLTKPRNPAAA
jgi:hypothetical protein